jgi:hypothetical protein
MKSMVLVLLLVALWASPVLAECLHNGRAYPTGT